MARKRRSNKLPSKKNKKNPENSEQNSNGVSDENEVDNENSSNVDDLQNVSSNSLNDINHKRFGKYRCLERRHSSSQDEESEYNPNDLMPQEIQDIVLGDVRDVIISQDDIANDTCLQDDVEYEEVIEETTECETSDLEECSDLIVTSYIESSLNISDSADAKSVNSSDSKEDLVTSSVKTLNLNTSIDECSTIIDDEVYIEEDVFSANNSVIESSEDNGTFVNTNCEEQVSELETNSDIDKCSTIEIKKNSDEKKKSLVEEPLRRSNRIRINRSTDDEPVKPLNLNEINASSAPQQNSLFEADKPVKVKSRWRRTSEMEMGGSSTSLNSDCDQNSGNMELPPLDPEVEERLKCFEIISYNVFLTTRTKIKESKGMLCDCTLTKEEIAKGEKGCGEDCLNRLLNVECCSRCLLGNQCSNRLFQNFQYTKCQVIKTKRKGLGLITTVNVGAGAFLMEYVGEVLDHKEFRRRAKDYAKEKNAHYYFMALKSDTIIDATLKGNISRFINHSCDPNSETQKWTVNSELRIGFFSKRPIAKGEEITFDYQLQRYGKEAQRCYCESTNCRGWIGEDPDKEKEREKEKEKKESTNRKEKKEKKKKEEKRRELREFLNYMDLEEEIEKLSGSGVKNVKHTLTLNRLMVRAEEEKHRQPLLKIAQAADQCCQRLFLDYQGLHILWSWMMDTRSSPKLRLEILNTLAVLPITNKTILKDSKILSIVEKWAMVENEEVAAIKESNETDDSSPGESSVDKPVDDKVIQEKDEELEKSLLSKSTDLISAWAGLKEDFRIPKKERIEQMKEHEREANRGYVDPRENQSYDRRWSYEKDSRYVRDSDKETRYSRENDKEGRFIRDRKRGRDSSPDANGNEWRKREDRFNGSSSRLSKTERRQLFALKVEEEDRQRKMDGWAKHQSQIHVPPTTQMEQNFFQQPPYLPNPDSGEILYGGCTPVFPPPPFSSTQPPPPSQFIDSSFPPQVPPPVSFHQYTPLPTYRQAVPVASFNPFPYNPTLPQVFAPSAGLPSPITLPAPSLHLSTPPPLPVLPAEPRGVIVLPPKWRSATDKEGRIYFYHLKFRKSQWQMPTEDAVPQLSDSESDSDESTDEEDTDSDSDKEEEAKEEFEYDDVFEDEEIRKDEKKEEDEEQLITENVVTEDSQVEEIQTTLIPVSTPPTLKKRREGLVQVNIISPRDEDYDYRCGIKKKQIRETKVRLAKEKKRQEKKRSGGAAKCEADTSVGGQRRDKKDLFRIQMANVVVGLLNPYRKNDCKTGKITNTEDFKHLARKLTHFVMVKELKHCASVDELQCNDNVKHKARDFIRKYMNKFGSFYKRSPDD